MRVLKPEFEADLAVYGPGSRPDITLADARLYTRSLAGSHYENFPVATRVLPRPMRQPIADVYAFSRWADDLGDEVEPAADSLRLLDWWQGELDRCFAGEAAHPVFVALRQTAADFDLPQAPFDDLIDAFRQDQTVTRYETAAEVADYCRRSANPVGRLVLHLAGQATEANLADSDAICTGLQLANFCQDIARDAAIGRCYLPLDQLDRYGLTPNDLVASRSSAKVQAMVAAEVTRAEDHLNLGAALPGRLPLRVGLTVDLFRRGGLAICRRIRQAEHRVLERRPKVTKLDAARELAVAVGQRINRATVRQSPHR